MGALVEVALVVGGLALAFAGVRFFDLAVSVTGFLIGALIGTTYVGGQADPSTLELAGGVIVGGIVGVGLAWAFVKFVVMAPGFLAGAGTAVAVLDPGRLADAQLLTLLVVLFGGLVGAAIAWALFRVVVAVLTAGVGATLVSLGGNLDGVVDAVVALDPGALPVDSLGLVFWLVFVLGTVAQIVQLAAGTDDDEDHSAGSSGSFP
ncbi:MAG: DUF4203 domain-containing protein [Halobacteriales archaeon]